MATTLVAGSHNRRFYLVVEAGYAMQAAEHARQFATAVSAAREQARAAKPDKKAWLEGPFATELKTLSEMALGRPLANSQQSLAAHTVQVNQPSSSVTLEMTACQQCHTITPQVLQYMLC